MNSKNNEDLKDLLSKFFDDRQASNAADDITAGDILFDSNPAPKPSLALLAEITQRMMAAVRKQRRWIHHVILQVAAMAAAIILVAWAGIMLLQSHIATRQFTPEQAELTFWREPAENDLDAQLAQIDQTDADEPVITFEANGSHALAIAVVAQELNDISGTFW
jgi:hypothetical protein